MSGWKRRAACVAAGILAGCAMTTAARAATFPYQNDFSAAGLPNATAGFVHDAANGQLDYAVTAGATNPVDTASVDLTGLGTTDFVVSTRFTLNVNGTDTANLSTVGFGVLSAANNFLNSGGQSYYLADWGVNATATTKGQLRIVQQGDSSGVTNLGNGDSDGANPNGSSVVAGNTYELRLTGAYAAGTLTMTLALFDAVGNQLGTPAGYQDTSPMTGQFFGFRNRLVNSSGLTDISYDDFNVTNVPEPALAGAGAMAAASMLLRRRRRRHGPRANVE